MKKGFTLLETLVAIAILSIAIAGPLYAANRALVAAQNARNQLTASHLAQEGVEYMRRLRDNEYLEIPGFPDGAWSVFRAKVQTCSSDAPCKIDVLANGLSGTYSACGSSCPLYLNAQGQYVLTGSAPTPYTRKVHLVWRDKEADVVSRVSWDFKGTTYYVEIIDTLRPWEPAQS